MRVINKKLVVVVLLIIEFTCGYLMYQSSKKEVDLAKVTYEEEMNNNMFAMYVENEETGEYDEVTNTNTFPEGYILNMDKTGCIDNKGNSISDILTSKDDKVMVKSNKTVFCYLYFDKDNRVYTQVKSDYKNNTGALLLSETESDEYPVYYYNGNITNNNILYANFCWKMVRTTEAGGVKLIYNGVPDESEDGTLTCDNTGEESQIGSSKFNASHNSLAYTGYMYNSESIYYDESKNLPSIDVFSRLWNPSTYYYGDIAIWNEETQQYDLQNADGSEVTTYTWSESYNNLVGYYTCQNSTITSCDEVYYVSYGERWWMYYYELSNGKTKDDYKIKLATEITDNGDETFALVNPISVSKADWYTSYSNYKNYYYCENLISEICNNMYYSHFPSSLALIGNNINEIYKYGNSVKYENGVYTLVDTIEFWNWPDNYNKINNYHYTCFNITGECEKVYYIFYGGNNMATYITLNDGKNVEDALKEMLYAEDVNQTNSIIKDIIDTWYESNILDAVDSSNILYSNYLEDTIWCSNREMGNLNGWISNGGDITKNLYFNSSSLKCENKTDQFTLKVENGGKEGYGNNALDYPIALLSFAELKQSGSFVNSKNNYWTISPNGYHISGYLASVNFYSSSGSLYANYVSSLFGVRPSVSLSNKVEITSGNGTIETPYQIILPI